ncbi:hypothetical protein J6590_005682 [Homalodisca vitripennis]|nr:hypothetical protein J6590_005682 [Homalodisca vitripennis]
MKELGSERNWHKILWSCSSFDLFYCELLAENLNVDRGAKSAHGHGQGGELRPPYSKGMPIQGMDTATALI